ncbi:flagellar motor switch protein FliM, partial [Ruegeria sp. NA]|nr:flagellar motor switch protein FliM [Ruegeria sp. NA]
TEVLTIDRTRAGIGRLGQCGGLRAVRLNEAAALPALTGADAQDFIASKSETPPQDYPVEPAEHDAHAQIVPAGVSDLTDSDLIVNDSERMVAEITQLAGLAPPESTS